MKNVKFIHKSRYLKWEKNFERIKDKSILRCWILTVGSKIQPKWNRCDAPGYEGRISGIPYCSYPKYTI